MNVDGPEQLPPLIFISEDARTARPAFRRSTLREEEHNKENLYEVCVTFSYVLKLSLCTGV